MEAGSPYRVSLAGPPSPGLRGVRRLAAEQRAHFRLTEPAVSPGCPDAADAAGCRPPSNRLRVYSEERSHLPGSEKALIVAIHVPPLLSPFRSMPSVSRKHPFTSLFSPKICRWCPLGASGPPDRAGTRAQQRRLAGRIAGCIREVAGGARPVPPVARCGARDYRMCKALLRTPGDFREFADSGAGATGLASGNPGK